MFKSQTSKETNFSKKIEKSQFQNVNFVLNCGKNIAIDLIKVLKVWL